MGKPNIFKMDKNSNQKDIGVIRYAEMAKRAWLVPVKESKEDKDFQVLLFGYKEVAYCKENY